MYVYKYIYSDNSIGFANKDISGRESNMASWKILKLNGHISKTVEPNGSFLIAIVDSQQVSLNLPIAISACSFTF